MKYRILYYFFFLMIFAQISGCYKEYSYEGGSVVVHHDSIVNVPPPVKGLPACLLCRSADPLVVGKWSFKCSGTYLCGSVDANAAGVDFGKTAFTFFGPSACSTDTGIVMTIYLEVQLDQDRFNLSTDKNAFFYYDHFGTNDIYISRPSSFFTVNVESYIHSTKILTGNFNGIAFKPNGDSVAIEDGRFKIQFK